MGMGGGGWGIPRSEGPKLGPEPGKRTYLLLPPRLRQWSKNKLCHSQSLIRN